MMPRHDVCCRPSPVLWDTRLSNLTPFPLIAPIRYFSASANTTLCCCISLEAHQCWRSAPQVSGLAHRSVWVRALQLVVSTPITLFHPLITASLPAQKLKSTKHASCMQRTCSYVGCKSDIAFFIHLGPADPVSPYLMMS